MVVLRGSAVLHGAMRATHRLLPIYSALFIAVRIRGIARDLHAVLEVAGTWLGRRLQALTEAAVDPAVIGAAQAVVLGDGVDAHVEGATGAACGRQTEIVQRHAAA